MLWNKIKLCQTDREYPEVQGRTTLSRADRKGFSNVYAENYPWEMRSQPEGYLEEEDSRQRRQSLQWRWEQVEQV